jgi:cytochrome oxidase Cu insertion factor (SCO1/SenC/PrrC family)
MNRALALLALMALTPGSTPMAQEPKKPEMAKMTLKVGDVAPNFTLPSNQGKAVSLSDFRGKQNVFLAVYVLAFTGG